VSAHSPFCYAGKNRPLDSNWWVGIPLSLLAQPHVSSHGWLVGAASGRAIGAGHPDASRSLTAKQRMIRLFKP
jgi:hypothetical protein